MDTKSTEQKFIRVLATYGENSDFKGRVYAVTLGEGNCVRTVSGLYFGRSTEGEQFEYVDLSDIHVEINGDRMTLAALIAVNSEDGCEPLESELISAVCELPIGGTLDGLHDEDITRVAAPVTMYRTAQLRDGGRPHETTRRGFSQYTKEEAIRDLFKGWERFMDEDFAYNTPGEVLDEGDDENPSLVAGGELGWYRCGNNSVGHGRADFATEDYPLTAEEWVAKDIDSYRDDVYTIFVEESTEYQD